MTASVQPGGEAMSDAPDQAGEGAPVQQTAVASDATELAAIEAAADEAIAICGGDLRATIAALIVANRHIEHELALTRVAVSSGFSRGWHRSKRAGPTDE